MTSFHFHLQSKQTFWLVFLIASRSFRMFFAAFSDFLPTPAPGIVELFDWLVAAREIPLEEMGCTRAGESNTFTLIDQLHLFEAVLRSVTLRSRNDSFAELQYLCQTVLITAYEYVNLPRASMTSKSRPSMMKRTVAQFLQTQADLGSFNFSVSCRINYPFL